MASQVAWLIEPVSSTCVRAFARTRYRPATLPISAASASWRSSPTSAAMCSTAVSLLQREPHSGHGHGDLQ